MWSISARNITQAGQDATNRSKTSPKIIVVALAEVLRTPNKGNQYQIEVGQNTPPSKPWLESLTLSLVRLASLTYFLAGVISPMASSKHWRSRTPHKWQVAGPT